MSLNTAIFKMLSEDPAINAIVNTRVYPSVIPQKTALPAIIYSQDTNEPTNVKQNPSTLDVIRMEIDCFADTIVECDQLAKDIRRVLDRFSGTVENVVIDSVTFMDEDNDFEKATRAIFNYEQYFNFRIKRIP